MSACGSIIAERISRPDALLFIFFSCGEDFPRSSLGPGWLELPIFPPRRADGPAVAG